MNTVITQNRQTKYCQAIEVALHDLGHATNNELLAALHIFYPDVSPTTIHRATTRLALRNVIAVAPSTPDGSMRYDANTKPHDHFECLSCGILRDIDIKDKITPIIESSINGCCISGQLIIKGGCKKCLKK